MSARIGRSRRVIAIALSLSVIGAAIGVTAVGVGAAQATTCTYTDSTYSDLYTHLYNAASGSTICLGANISQTSTDPTPTPPVHTYLFVKPNGTLTLDLHGHSLVVNNYYGSTLAAGIVVLNGSALTILDSAGGGTLDVTGDDDGAGIGGGQGSDSGDVTIAGGTVIAHGGSGAAGIGGGTGANQGGTVTISGGTVTVYGGAYGGAAIGGGSGGNGGTVVVSGGDLTASGGNNGGSGIGGGFSPFTGSGSGGPVSISGGTVHATGHDGGSGIGAAAGGSSNGSIDVFGTCSTSPASSCHVAAGNGWSGSTLSNAAMVDLATPANGTVSVSATDDTGAGLASVTIAFSVSSPSSSPSSGSPSSSPSSPSPSASASASASATTAQVSVASLPRGNTLTVTGSGFVPAESVAIYLHSTPVLLGTTLASSTGTITANVTIPAGTAVGAHQIELRGTQTTTSAFANLTVTAARVSTGGIASAAPGATWPLALLGLGGMLLLASGVAARRVRRLR